MRERLAGFFCVDDPWERRGDVGPRDWVVGVATLAVSLLALELVRSAGGLDDVDEPVWAQWLALVVGALLLVPRRRWPLTTALLAAAHMFATGVVMPAVMAQLALQLIYFAALFSGVAWARSRRDMLLVMGAVVVFMGSWLAWQFALGNAVDALVEESGASSSGPFGPVTGAVGFALLVNALYFGGAIAGGQVAWRGARQRARLAEQAGTIHEQARALEQRAVVEERLRIARELHDVVAHHVSVVGIQAAAGRRVLDRDPAAAAEALARVEESSREAVVEMRSLVGTLRAPDPDASDDRPADRRAPEPGWVDVASLVAAGAGGGLRVDHDAVEQPLGAAAHVPAAIGLSAYRTVQEALTNVRRHSTADRARVVTRVDRVVRPAYAEVEVTDDGRPRAGTSGSGLGLLGVRERAAARGAEVDIGPRAVGGFRVRVRFPLEEP